LTGEVYRLILAKKGDWRLSITADIIRGHTDAVILAQLLEKDSYGYEINKAIQLLTDGEYELKEATLYTAFRRLEEAGHVNSYWGNEQSGARRRYYKLTPGGRAYYERIALEWVTAKEIIDKLIRGSRPDERENS